MTVELSCVFGFTVKHPVLAYEYVNASPLCAFACIPPNQAAFAHKCGCCDRRTGVDYNDLSRDTRTHLFLPSCSRVTILHVGKLNHLVIQIMESNGMNKQLILESLGRCAYDHLTATYLLLGERLRHTARHSLPHT
ncbi:unnamed protein product, partial [Dibothriocephalus latus]